MPPTVLYPGIGADKDVVYRFPRGTEFIAVDPNPGLREVYYDDAFQDFEAMEMPVAEIFPPSAGYWRDVVLEEEVQQRKTTRGGGGAGGCLGGWAARLRRDRKAAALRRKYERELRAGGLATTCPPYFKVVRESATLRCPTTGAPTRIVFYGGVRFPEDVPRIPGLAHDVARCDGLLLMGFDPPGCVLDMIRPQAVVYVERGTCYECPNDDSSAFHRLSPAGDQSRRPVVRIQEQYVHIRESSLGDACASMHADPANAPEVTAK